MRTDGGLSDIPGDTSTPPLTRWAGDKNDRHILIMSTLDDSPPQFLNLKLLRPQGQIIDVK